MGMFGNLTGYLDEQEIPLPDDAKLSVLNHPKNWWKSLDATDKNIFGIVRNPFKADLDDQYEAHKYFLRLKHDSGA